MLAKEFCLLARIPRVALTWVILLFGLFFTLFGLHQRAEAAAYATGGTGKYKEVVLWMTWGDTALNSLGIHGVDVTTGSALATSTASHLLPGNRLMEVGCTLDNITRIPNNVPGVLRSYRSGNYYWDGLQFLYNTGGTLSNNTLINGIRNATDSQTITFDVVCTATIDGSPVKIPGLVVADAESMAIGEYIHAVGEGTWQVVEVKQNLDPPLTPYNVSKQSVAGGRQRLIIADGADKQLSAVSFMKLTTPSSTVNFNIEIRGGGGTGMAFGLLVPYADFGDAPQTYGDAVHLIQDLLLKDDGVVVDGGITNFNSSTINLNNLGIDGTNTNYLGSKGPDADGSANYTSDANGDNNGGFIGTTEEDAWTLTNIYLLQANNTLTRTIACHGTGYVAGWIDFNRNGIFDATERSTGNTTCNGTSVDLSWTIPAFSSISTGKSYVRLRLSTDSASLINATSIAPDGEVEDHVVNLVAPSFEITKTSNATSAGWYQGQANATYSLTIQNVGGVGNNDPALTVSPVNNALKEVFVLDSLPTGITPNWTGTLASGIFTCTYVGQNITCRTTTNIAPSTSTTLTIPISITSAINGSLTNYASVGGGFDPYNNGAPPVPNSCTPVTNKHCTSLAVDIKNPVITLAKSASPASGTRVFPGDEITYTLTATVTNNPLVSNLELTDVLPAGLEFISVSANPGGFVDTFSTNGKFTLNTTPSKAPGTYSVSFRARVTDAARGAGNLVNTLSGTGGSPVAPTCTACTTTHPVSVSQLRITKSAAVNGSDINDVGDQIKFSFFIENIGDTTINGITVTDPMLAGVPVTIPSVPSLVAGATTTVETLYTLRASDFVAGKVDNIASAAGTDTYTRAVKSNDSSTTTPLTARSGLSVVKTGGTPSGNTAGSTVVYTFVVSNTGNVDLTGVKVNDPFLAAAGITVPTIGALAAGASATVTATYPLQTSDFVAAQVVNTATAEGTPPTGTPVTSDPSTVTTLLTQEPAIALLKTASAPSGNAVGDTITFSFAVSNTGNVPFTNVGIDDIFLALAGVSIPAVGNLGVGETKTVTATYPLTKADFIAGKVDNTATTRGEPPSGTRLVSAPSSTSTPLVQTPQLALIKTAQPATGTDVGDVIPYSLQVINTGDLPLTDVVISDPLLADSGLVIPSIASLAVGETRTVNINYVLTAADFVTARVDNTATATAKDPSNQTVPSNPSSTVTPLNKLSSLVIVKTASAPTGAEIGDTITYTFAVTNSGNQPLNSVVVNDPMLITAGVTLDAIGDLAVGQTKTVTGIYTLSGADFIKGTVENSAVAFAKDPAGVPYTSLPDDTTTPLTQNPALSLTKAASTPSGSTAGDTVTFRFVVENTGNLPLTNVVVEDPLLTAQGVSVPPVGDLAVGEAKVVTAIYTLTTADFVNGKVDNTANARGTDSSNTPVISNPASATAPLLQTPSMALLKTASAPSGDRAGATVTYSFAVTNTGNLPLSNVTINDNLLSVAGVTVPVIATLAVGQTLSVDAIYTLTQADFDAGKVLNTAFAQAQDSSNQPLVSDPSSTETALTQQGQLRLVKTAAAPTGQEAGATITYSFSVENIGNVVLQNVRIEDPLLTNAGVSVAPISRLEVGQTLVVDAVYTLTQFDIDRGQVDNSATAVGRDPADKPITSNPSDTSTPLAPDSGLRLVKTAGDLLGDRAGATIVYTFNLTNTGATTLSNLEIIDGLLANARIAIDTVTSLTPGASQSVTATYVVTQADFDKGLIENVAQARGTDPKGNPVNSNPDETRSFLKQYPELAIKKQAYAPVTDKVGDLVEYSFEVTNIGNVQMRNILINDPMLAAAGVPIPAVGNLAPGESRRVTATYTLVEPDFARGFVENIATSTGTPPDGQPYESPPSEKIVYLTPTPQMTLTKLLRAGPTPVTQTGQVLTYTVEVRNTGNMNLAGIAVQDMLNSQALAIGSPSGNGGDPAVLEVDEVWRYTFLYTVTQADMDARAPLVNRATVTSTTTGVNTPPVAEVIVPIVVPGIAAQDDRYSTRTNRDSPTHLGVTLVNDTLDGIAVRNDQVTIRVGDLPSDAPIQPYLDEQTGDVVAPPNTPAGEYEIPYTICERYNPNNCAYAVVRVTVVDSDILATDDNYQYDPKRTRAGIGNILLNDSSNKSVAVPASVRIETLAVSHPALSLDTQTGEVSLDLNAQPGAYHLDYRICQVDNLSMCDEARVTITVQPELQLQLTKSTQATQVRLGDIVRYSLTATNQAVSDVTGFTLIDTPPQGFSYVAGSLDVMDRDGRAQLTSASPIRIENISVAQGESVTITYLLRVGPGAAALGTYTNNARAFDGEQPISNPARASVERVGDALFEDSRIIGSVYWDRDGNQWQAHADATDVVIKGGFTPEVYVPNSTRLTRAQQTQIVPDASAPLLKGIKLGSISGTDGVESRSNTEVIIISQRLTAPRFTDDLTLHSAEGSRVSLDRNGQMTQNAVGDVKRGRNVQALEVKRFVFPQADGQVLVEYHLRNLGKSERGLPGVRLATVEGLLVTTDAYGRYHLEGNSVENFARGENMLIKVDESTLPTGMRLSTPNPLLKRVTQGLPTRFDFGVTRRDNAPVQTRVDVDIEVDLFVEKQATLIESAQSTLDGLRDLINQHAEVRLLLPSDAAASHALNLERAQRLQDALAFETKGHFVIALMDTDGSTWATLDADTLILHKSLQLHEATQAALIGLIQTRADKQQPLYLSLNKSDAASTQAMNRTQLSVKEAQALFNQLAQYLTHEQQEYLRIHTTSVWLAAQGGAQ